MAGEWDKNRRKYDETKRKHLDGFFNTNSIEESTFYRSLEEHYKDNVEWENTSMFNQLLSAIKDGHTVWRGSSSEEELLDRCSEIDDIYGGIKKNGYISQVDLCFNSDKHRNYVSIFDILADEITVDISRDGELLFVDGRHRASIAKILNIDFVPVSILMRHSDWMDERERIYSNESTWCDHPDVSEFSFQYKKRNLVTENIRIPVNIYNPCQKDS